ncbi:DUF429 domain-containing protein [Frigoribacterium salinisoli]
MPSSSSPPAPPAPRSLGVDLAWGEGTAARPPAETGLVVLDADGSVLDAGWARGLDAVHAWITAWVVPGSVVAVDAPLLLPNATGMRPGEREVGRGYGRWHVSANASNAGMRWQAGRRLRERLEQDGLAYDDGLAPHPSGTTTLFECYPYTTLVGTEELGYDDRRPRYKRPDRSLPLAERRAARAVACDDLLARLGRLDAATPPLRLASHPVTRALLDEPSPLVDRAYKHREDLLDAAVAAWTAALRRDAPERLQVLGAASDPVQEAHGRRATILAPARPEQRTSGAPSPMPLA